MFHIVLHRPEIPPNTGNIIRLCANTGCRLHLVEPLGFIWDDRRLRRAGLDHADTARVARHADLAACRTALGQRRWFAFSTRGVTPHTAPDYRQGDVLLFGSETAGLPGDLLAAWPAERLLRLPMIGASRSLNLSNTVAVAVYEAWRHLDFIGSGSGDA